LAVLRAEEIAVLPEGLRVTIRRSKGDQEGEGQILAIGRTGTATCPVAALEGWLAAAGLVDGRVFRSVDRHSRLGAGLSTRVVAQIVLWDASLAAKPWAEESLTD
jgi:hypothetical protein